MNLSVKQYIPLLIIVLVLFESGYVYFGDVAREIDRLERESIGHRNDESAYLQGVLDFMITAGHLEQAQSLVSGLKAGEHLNYAVLADRDGKIVAADQKKHKGSDLFSIPSLKKEFYNNKKANSYLHEAKYNLSGRTWLSRDEGKVISIYPIQFPSEQGSLRHDRPGLFIQEYDLTTRKQRIFSETIGSVLKDVIAFTLLAVLIGYLLHMRVSRRIGALVDMTEGFAKGDQSLRSDVQGNDEIGQLGNAFNRMIEQIQADRSTIEESRLRFETLTEVSPVGVFETGVDGNCTYVNRRWSEFTGLTLDEAIGEGWMRALHPEDKEMVLDAWSDSIKLGKPFSAECRFINTDGTISWVHGQTIAHKNEDGEIISYIGTVTDITARVAAQQQLEKHRDHLEELVTQRTMELVEEKKKVERASIAKTEFLSRMSHELRTPLNAIIGFSDLILMDKKNLSGDMTSSVKDINIAGYHLLELINEILDIQRIETGEYLMELETIDLGQIFRESLDICRPLAEQQKITTTIRDNCDAHYVYGDKRSLRQVMLNLISNAIKYNHFGGSVVVSCDELSDAVFRISVEDSGEGIREDQLDLVFEPFTRLSRTNRVEGVGIGLTITRKIVEAMGGKMGLESTPGEGSTFWFEMPKEEPRVTH